MTTVLTTVTVPRFPQTWCSQCGRDFGPGDNGFSECAAHRGRHAASNATLEALAAGPRRWYVVACGGKPVELLASELDASVRLANEAAAKHGPGAVAIPLGVSILPPTDAQIRAAVNPPRDAASAVTFDVTSLDDAKYQRFRRGDRGPFGAWK